jgi:CIC family chloride channel protein
MMSRKASTPYTTIVHTLRHYWNHHFHPSENATLLALAVAVGLASGIGIWGFRSAIDLVHTLFFTKLAQEWLGGSMGIVGSLALAGMIVGWMMERFISEERHHGVAGIIESVALAGGRLRYARMPYKAVASAFSLGAGASVGPEDPSVQIGASLGSFFGQRLRLSEDRVRLLVAAGAASAIAAAFNAPIAGVFFALEVILGEFTTGAFGVVVLASVIASVFIQVVEQAGPELGPLSYTLGSPVEIPIYILLGLLLAPVSALFIHVVYWQNDLWHRYVRLPRPLRTALAGALVGCVGIFLPQIMGAGREAMNEVLTGQGEFTIAFLLALGIAKLVMTPISLSGGFVGGIFAPSLFVGTMLGGAFGRVVDTFIPESIVGNPQAYAIAGMAAVMAGVVRAPITAILLVFELTNDYRLILPIMLTTVVCVYLSERFEPSGVYTLGLLRKGVRLQQGRDVDVMQGLIVREAMKTPAPTISENASLVELRDTLRRYHVRSICVVDGEGLLSGIVTLTDLQSAYENNGETALTVSDICTRQVITASPDDVLWTAIRNMGARDIGRLPVVISGTRQLVGMLSRHDIMTAYNTAIARKLEDQHQAEQIRLHTLTGAHVIDRYVTPDSPVVGQRIRDIPWPPECTVASIRRGTKLLVPHGSTQLQSGDWLTLVAAPEAESDVTSLFGSNMVNEP